MLRQGALARFRKSRARAVAFGRPYKAYMDSVPLLVTILELGTLALNIFTVYKVTDFFAGYGPLRFTGMNEAGTAKVVLIFDTMMNKLYTEEEYLKTFPFMK